MTNSVKHQVTSGVTSITRSRTSDRCPEASAPRSLDLCEEHLDALLENARPIGPAKSSGEAFDMVGPGSAVAQGLASPARDRSGDGETLREPLFLSPEAPPVDEPLLVGKLRLTVSVFN
jgi:hypothetical protein